MAKPCWFPFYTNDFLASSKVALLTTEEIGAYVLLLCHAWQDPQCSLPDDDEALSILGRIKGDMTNLRACFTVKKYRLINKRLYEEWIKTKDKSDLAKKSASLRWHQERNANALPTQCSSQSHSQSHSEEDKKDIRVLAPLASPVKVKRSCSTEYPADFEPDDRAKAIAEGYGQNVRALLAAFKDHHAAKGTLFKDWQAAFRMWLRNDVKFRERRHA